MISFSDAYRLTAEERHVAPYCDRKRSPEANEWLTGKVTKRIRRQTIGKIYGMDVRKHRRQKSEHRLTVPAFCLKNINRLSKNSPRRGGLETTYHEKEPLFSPEILSLQQQISYIVEAHLDGIDIPKDSAA